MCLVNFTVVNFAMGNSAEAPVFCVVNFVANLKRKISHMKLIYCPRNPPPHPLYIASPGSLLCAVPLAG